ncbi:MULTISPECIES: hypothetical protein [unclassified Roseateles]|uniref:hypothetical protein n=1 Tax=unclassified Roseateles TaxID=2626991 RepID=UPI0006FDA3A1|nr:MULTISPECIES: hypothetical protein [unclassified Roseateles]KQW41253.1 hypothetical protein ASC81_23535 [Pelomonas sp. Root405]KRA68024.1 hypothetical protein ASD88_21515 [Pelomonas sp. Root662]
MKAQSFAGRADFQRLLIETLAWTAEQGCRELHAWDASFVDWPLSDAQALAALATWARSGRQLHLLALQYDDVLRRHPRFVRWRRDYAHCVTARAVDPEVRVDAAPESLLLAAGAESTLTLRLFDRHLWRGEISVDAAQRLRALEWFDALAQRSSDSFAPTTLGL